MHEKENPQAIFSPQARKTGGKCNLQLRGQHGYQSILPFEAQAESVLQSKLFNAPEHKQGPAFSEQAQSCSAL